MLEFSERFRKTLFDNTAMAKDSEDELEEFWKQIDGKLSRDILKKNLDELDKQYHAYCVKKSGQLIADQIAQVDFTDFGERISRTLKRILENLLPKSLKDGKPLKACYLEYDPLNRWVSEFFLCFDYAPAKNQDDEWAGDWDEMINGPKVPMFAKLKIYENFGEKDGSVGAYVYAHARVVIEFAKASREFTSPIPICIGYHDQAVVCRIFPDSKTKP